MKRMLRLFLIERDPAMRAIVGGYIGLQEDMTLCGQADDSGRALGMLRRARADIVLLDLGFPRLDGLDFLRALPTLQLQPPPCVLVCSAVLDEGLAQEVLWLGAESLLPCPYPLDRLMDRIRTAPARRYAAAPERRNEAVFQLMASLHGTHRLSGYQYLAQALSLLLLQESADACPGLDQIYETLADRHALTYSAVESAMRKAVRRIFSINSPALQEILAASGRPGATHMSNGEFLFLLAAHLRAGARHSEETRGAVEK